MGLSGPPSNPATSSYASGGAMRADVWEFASDGTIKVFWTDPNGGEFKGLAIVVFLMNSASQNALIRPNCWGPDNPYWPELIL